jgi:hypothetical protein
MAKYVYNVKYQSWEEYYKKKKEEPDGYFNRFAKKRISAFDSLPSGYVNRPESFKTTVAAYPDRNFLLILAGGNLVRCIHHCFNFKEFEKQDSVVGISGSCHLSPFKIPNINSLVRTVLEPRTSEIQNPLETNYGSPASKTSLDATTQKNSKMLPQSKKRIQLLTSRAKPNPSRSKNNISMIKVKLEPIV